MKTAEELLHIFAHKPEEFPVLARQTRKVLRNGKIISKRININDNLMHYLRDTALLISKIDGRLNGSVPYDHVIYLDKSARPVSWLVNMFWDEFAKKDKDSNVVKRPRHTYINIDRAPWFRNVGINVDNDGRQKDNGDLATYRDFINKIQNLSKKHLAEIRALYIEGGIEEESAAWVMRHPTILDAKRVLIVDEVSRTGSTLEIAKHLFRLAIPEVAEIDGAYYWHPDEPVIKLGEETVMTSLPVWYDPDTLTGRGIGSTNPSFYRRMYEDYLAQDPGAKRINLRKFRTYAFSSSVFSAPLLDDNGDILDLAKEGKTRSLCKDLRRLYDDYKDGHVFFTPPAEWCDFDDYDSIIKSQGVLLLPWESSAKEQEAVRNSPLFYLNFITNLKKM